MEIKVGDIYVRHSNERVYRVKKIDNTMVVLKKEGDEMHQCLTDIFGLEKAYTKIEPKSA